ncbi:MAG: helix-turn-helix transcriptional regulator, partial [Oscillospiraceae bacterium]
LMCKYFIGTGTKDVDSPMWLASTVSQMKSIENFQIGFSRMLELSRCSEEHLCREFKKYYKTTPVKFINEQRLSYSLYLLSNTKTEIIEISQLCGFNNLSHFYHLFKEQFDVSPRKFRVSHQLNRAQTPFSNKY